MHTRYINPFTDFGFKRLFGEEPSKAILLDFLNELLREQEGEIKSITYMKNEHLGNTEIDRKAIFDIYCENEKGEKFIVELQKSRQTFFKDRSVYYSTFPIREQAKKGKWDFELKSVYTVGILDFVFEEDKHQEEKYRYDVKLIDEDTCKVFYDKLTFIYLEMPKFKKQIHELESKFEKWLYVIKNLEILDKYPVELQENIFEQFFQTAEIGKMTVDEYETYERSLMHYRDLKNSLDTAKDEGREEGRAEGRKEGIVEGRAEGRLKGLEEGIEKGKVEIALNLLKMNLPLEDISKATNLTVDQIKKLK
ncbi:Rpn family recombination-promoting nuclease/putative transposase [Flammeovirga aprica JL-4]|uniref:Rpn family recombination-promoting nuclease/putative transposase n=2 Tax=Flammeovirga aprica TaxID=29528 RepID=A0A7X9P071_9BACT|nr:Rpn family recombination-promoting nuclease/putative transposase [Flammeovirga aprica JL-4]